MTTQLVDQSASLNLLRDHNGTLLVHLRRLPHHVDTLSTVWRSGAIDGQRLFSAQADTVNLWFNSAASGEL